MKKKNYMLCAFMLMMVSLLSINLQAQDTNGWKKQLERLQQNKKLQEKGYPQLVSYVYQSDIKTAADVKKLKEQLLSDTKNYFPIADEASGSIKLVTLKEIQKMKGKEYVDETVQSLSEFFDNMIQPGMSTVKLTWKLGDKTYESVCVVSDYEVVYDHLVMNMMMVQ